MDYWEMLETIEASLGAEFCEALEEAVDQRIDDALYEQAAGEDL